MSQIKVSGLTFSYDGSPETIFDHVSCSLDTDWKLGFVGRNGRGKTTFLKLLMGEYPYQGNISSPVEYDYFPFGVPDDADDTLSVLGRVSGGAEEWRLKRELSLLFVGEDALSRPFCTLSSGERTKALLAALFVKEDRFLLIDEPTNHLDVEGRALVADYLAGKRGFLLVSHDRAFLNSCVDHILAINKSGFEVLRGNFSVWQRERDRREAFERGENEKLQADIRRLSQAARRTSNWSDEVEATKIGAGTPDRGYVGHKSAKMMKRAKAIDARRQNAIEEKEGLLKDVEYNSPLVLRPLTHHAKRLVEVRGLCVRYGEREVFDGLNFTVEQGECVALTGRNGSGKSSVVKLIGGEDIPHGGGLTLASGLIVSYVPQDTSFLEGNLLAFARHSNIDVSLFLTILRKLDFLRAHFEQDMRTYSMGQRKKVLIARSLCERAHLYLWDEPLNYIDVLSRIQIEDLLKAYKPTMLFVEHDRAFSDAVATKTIRL